MFGSGWRSWLGRQLMIAPNPDRAGKQARTILRPLVEMLESRDLLSWVMVANMPTPRSALAAAPASDGRIYAVGGMDATGNPLATVEAYNPTTNAWAAVTSLPMPLSGLAAAEGTNGRVYVMGGKGASGPTNSVEAYTPSTNLWNQVAPMPTPRSALAAVRGADGRIYAIGGMDTSGSPVATVEAYTPTNNTWKTVTSLPMPVSGLAAAEGSDGRIYAVGGTGPSGLTNVVEAYTPSTNLWTSVATLPTLRSGLGAATGTDGRTFAIGGADASGTPLATAEAYAPASNSWSIVGSNLPVARSGLAVVEGSDGRVYALAGTNGTAPVGEVDALTVNQPSTSTVVSSSSNPSVFGQSVTFTATVSVTAAGGTPTGTVQFQVDGSQTGGPVTVTTRSGVTTASFSTSTLAVGTHTVTATYSGEKTLAGSSGMLSQVVSNPNLPPPTNQAFLNQAYLDLLHRAPDASGLAAFTAALNQGATHMGVAMGIDTSPEYYTLVVQGLYQLYLRRAADPSGLSTGVQMLNAGDTIEEVAAFIAGSPEFFQNQGGGTNAGFLNALYQDALGRALDSSGQTTYTGALAAGVNRSQVALAVLTSLEYRENLVQGYYQSFLHRAADPGGLGSFVGDLERGDRDELVIAAMIGSDEYFQRL